MKLQRLAFALVSLAACDRSADAPKPEAAPAPAPAPAPDSAGEPALAGEPVRTPADLALRLMVPPASEEDEVPEAKVELPPKPELRIPDVPATHPDGVYSIRGLREASDALLAAADAGTDEELRVRAYVQEVVTAPPCPSRGRCVPGQPTHAWLADESGLKGRRTALLMVGHEMLIPSFEAKTWKGVPRVTLAAGQAYTFKARFRRDAFGMGDPRGVLEFVAVEVEAGSWLYAPGSREHPISVAAEEERTRQMMRKLRGG